MAWNEIRRNWQGEFPAYTVTLNDTDVVIHWGNSYITQFGNSLLDHLSIVMDDMVLACFQTVEHEDTLDMLKEKGWEVVRVVGPIAVEQATELAATQLIGELEGLEQDL